MIRHRSVKPPETELRQRLRDLANGRRRFGYLRLFVLLRREGEPSGINRIYRIYREEGLAVRRRRARRKAIGTRAPILVEARPNARWSLDFVHDQLAYGRRFRILNVVDDVTRECLAAIPDTSISGRRVVRELAAVIDRRGLPVMSGVSSAVWLCKTKFRNMAHARAVILAWATDYNEERPHSALGYQTPKAFAGDLLTATDTCAASSENSAHMSVAPPAPIGVSTQRAPVPAG